MKIVVVGAGVFGVTAARELRRRGHRVAVLDPGPLPHPLAASTDISKVIRMAYGPDALYMALMERARDGWLRWNAAWRAAGAEPLYHETGVLMVCREPMRPGGFEYESFRLLEARGHAPERLDARSLVRRYPAWRAGAYVDGFYHAQGGYAESGRVMAALTSEAERAGVEFLPGRRAEALFDRGGRVRGVRAAGEDVTADAVLVSAGAWTAPFVGGAVVEAMRVTGHPVFHLRPDATAPFAAERFPVFTADVARTGYYGFPLSREGIVKIGNHGPGTPIEPDAPRAVAPVEHDRLRGFLAETFPALVEAEIVSTRACLYADSQDGDFWIARDPDRPGLTVATGDSGHGFKFAPVLGGIIADAVLGEENPLLDRFRWRPEVRLARGREAARWHG